MLDSWFWDYLLRVLVVTGVMVGLIYAAFFWMKSKGMVAENSAVQQPMLNAPRPPRWLVLLQQRFGLATLAEQSRQQPEVNASHQPVHKTFHDTAVTFAAGEVSLHGPLALNAEHSVGVVSIGQQHWVVASGPNGITLLAETTLPEPSPASEETFHA